MKLRARSAGLLVLMAGLSACDVPTGMPRWETTWIAPGEEMTVSVVELLPAGLTANEDTSAFLMTIDPVNESWALSDFCAACPPVTATAPKPAFAATVTTTLSLPGAVQLAEVDGGDIVMQLVNGFEFDPIRPGMLSDSGSLTVTIRSGATTVASVTVDGTEQAFAPGDTLDLTLGALPSTIGGDLDVELTLDSPAGDPVSMSPSDALTGTIASDGVVVSEATVDLAGQAVDGGDAELDLQDVDLADRLNDGAIFLDIENPFGVTGNLTITVDPENGAPIVKPVTLVAGSSTSQVDFTESEIEQLVGTVSTLSFSGTVNGGSVTVAPDMAIGVTVRMRVTIEVGGDPDGED